MTDAISRKSVIDMLDETKRIARHNIDGAVLMTFEKVLDSLVNIINSLPTIQPEPHWIPVTKDTPKEAGTYMCTCYDAGRRIVTLVKWQPRTKTWNLIGARAYWKVTAWYNLPEPYKGVTT